MFSILGIDQIHSPSSLNSPKNHSLEITNQNLSPKSAISRLNKYPHSSPKIIPKHSKGFYSRPKLQNKLSKKHYQNISPIKQRLVKTAHPSHNFQAHNTYQHLNPGSSKAYIPFKDVLQLNTKENTSKPDKSKKNFNKKGLFDASNFVNHLKSPSSPIKFSTLSTEQEYLFNSFTEEFSKVAKRVDLLKSGRLNYSNFCQVLNQLKFITNPISKSEEEAELVLKSWKILGGLTEQKVLFEDLYLFLLAVLRIPYKIKQSQNFKEKKTLWLLTQKGIQSIPEEFILFFNNRNLPEVLYSQTKSSSEEISEGSSIDQDEIMTPEQYLREINKQGDRICDNIGESEESDKISSLITLPNKSDFINNLGKISLSMVFNKETKPDLNSTVSYKKDSKSKMQLNGINDKLGDSMIYESNLLNISELPFVSQNFTQRRNKRQNSLILEKKSSKED